MSDFDAVPAFLSILKDNWNDANTEWGGTPRFASAWEEDDDFDTPHVVLPEPNENPLLGGDTGFTGIQGNGRPMQRILGDINLFTVAHGNMNIDGKDPSHLSHQMSTEVRRIVSETYLEPVEGVYWWSFFSRTGVADTVRRPTIYRQECLIRYCYDHRL